MVKTLSTTPGTRPLDFPPGAPRGGVKVLHPLEESGHSFSVLIGRHKDGLRMIRAGNVVQLPYTSGTLVQLARSAAEPWCQRRPG